jgi:hypothetical protein
MNRKYSDRRFWFFESDVEFRKEIREFDDKNYEESILIAGRAWVKTQIGDGSDFTYSKIKNQQFLVETTFRAHKESNEDIDVVESSRNAKFQQL